MSNRTMWKVYASTSFVIGLVAVLYAFIHFNYSKMAEIIVLTLLFAAGDSFGVLLPRSKINHTPIESVQMLCLLMLGRMAPIPRFIGSFFLQIKGVRQGLISLLCALVNLTGESAIVLIAAVLYERLGGTHFRNFSEINFFPLLAVIVFYWSFELISLHIYSAIANKKSLTKFKLLPTELLFELSTAILAIPAYMVYNNFGMLGLISLCIPFLGWFALFQYLVGNSSAKRESLTLFKVADEIISSKLDFDAMAGNTLSKVRSLLELTGSELFLKEQGKWVLKVFQGKSPWQNRAPTNDFLAEIEDALSSVPGFFDDPPYREGFKVYVNAGFRSLLIVPLLSGEEIIGFIVCTHQESHFFDVTYKDFAATLSVRLGTAFSAATLHNKLVLTLKELHEARAELVQLEKMAGLGQLVAGVAHEMNSPLNAMFITAPALNERFSSMLPAGEQDDFGKMTMNLELSVRKLSGIVKNLEIFAKAQASKETWRDVSVRQVVETSLESLRSHYADRVEIHQHIDEDARIWCNPTQIEQLFKQVLLNGMQAVQGNGNLWIDTIDTDQKLTITIRDSGSGIPREIQNRIFEPFFTTREIGEGAGLGLSVAYGIMRAHSGEIRVESEVGKGTTVTLIFPMVGAGMNREALRAPDALSAPQAEMVGAG